VDNHAVGWAGVGVREKGDKNSFVREEGKRGVKDGKSIACCHVTSARNAHVASMELQCTTLQVYELRNVFSKFVDLNDTLLQV